MSPCLLRPDTATQRRDYIPKRKSPGLPGFPTTGSPGSLRLVPSSPVPAIAITGGIASGKSTFTRVFQRLTGAPTFDTDVSARRLLAEDRAVLAAVRVAFGSGVFDATGAVSRAALRGVVFADPARRRDLEAILHPRVRADWQRWLESGLQTAPDALRLVEIPLLYETGAAVFFDQVIVVGCSPATQRLRLTGGRQLTDEVARQIIASQWELTEKMSRGHHVVWNEGSEERLHAQAALCVSLYSTTGSKPPS